MSECGVLMRKRESIGGFASLRTVSPVISHGPQGRGPSTPLILNREVRQGTRKLIPTFAQLRALRG